MDDGQMDVGRGEKQLYWTHVDSWVNMDRREGDRREGDRREGENCLLAPCQTQDSYLCPIPMMFSVPGCFKYGANQPYTSVAVPNSYSIAYSTGIITLKRFTTELH